MGIRPILSALRRHKAGTLLIALQIGLTLAIVCNALFIIGGRIAKIERPSGLDERDLLFVSTSHAGLKADTPAGRAALAAGIQGDLTALRHLPDVQDAYETNALSLSNINWTLGLKLSPDARGGAPGAFFFADDHTLATLGLKLVAGRDFKASEIGRHSLLGTLEPPVVIITKHMADSLFPKGDALGKQVYFVGGATKPSTIIGIVQRMQTGNSQSERDSFTWNSILIPMHMLEPARYYVVRAKPGRLDAALHSVPAALYAQDPLRVIPDGTGADAGVRSFAQIRAQAYRGDIAMAQLMGVISVILLAVTAAGIVGLSSFWVGQRRKQIGVRRALGATRGDILSYFLTENLLISMGGVLLGVALVIGLNLWMVTRFEMAHLPVPYVLVGAVVLLLLGQGAVLAPALRASRVPPVEATRSV
ncbi:MAG: FtsX-like permease family protein [Rhodanobacter sp.]|nr:MAG: FtsX-like permease family protein [Rhodanobacter sp.]